MINVIHYLFNYFACILPFVVIGTPIWLDIILILLISFAPILGTITSITLWIVGFVKISQMPFSWLTIVYIIVFVLHIIIRGGSLIVTLNKRKNKRDYENDFWKTVMSFNKKYPLAFKEVFPIINAIGLKEEDKINALCKNGKGKSTALGMIGNIAGDMCESGNHHSHRGVLNPTGEELYSMFSDALWQSVDIGEVDEEWVKNNIAKLNKNISEVG